jgi:hypothetical protein
MSVNPYQPPASESTPLVAELVVDETGWTINFEIGIEDLVTWNLYCHRHLPVLRRGFVRGWLFIGAAMILIGSILIFFDPSAVASHVVMGAVFAGLFAAYPWFYRLRVRRMCEGMFREGANSNVIGPRRVTLLPEYLVYSTPMSQTITRWAGMERVLQEKEVIYLLLANVTAIPVPRRAFATDDQFQQFAKAAAEFHAAAKPAAIA